MSNKIFAFDVDGTLLDYKNYEVPRSAYQAIDTLRQNNHICGICTGRNKTQFQKAPVDISKFDFIVYCNGGYFEINDQKIADISFTKNETEYLYQYLDQNQLEYGVSTYHHLYAKHPLHQKVTRIISAFNAITPEEKADFRDLDIVQCTIYEEKIDDSIVTELRKHFFVYTIDGLGYDIVPKRLDKAFMLQKVANHYNLTMKDTIAFGDAHNDLMFLEHAGIGIAMGNASDHVKSVADMVTSETYNEGIYNAIKLLGYL